MSGFGPSDSQQALAALPAGVARAAAGVLPALRNAALRTGADFGALFNMARVESGFRPDARAATSSARGMFQFIDSTWLQLLNRHGARNGIPTLPRKEALALRDDPGIASLMAAESMRDNAATLEGALGRKADAIDLYFAHFLGARGASRFLGALQQAPDAYGAALFPAAAQANRPIFYAGDTPRSLAEIHQLISARLAAGNAPTATAPAVLSGRLPAAPAAIEPAGIAPREAARLAYLLLAELAG